MTYKDDLADMNDTQLVAAYIADIYDLNATEHIGAQNRHVNRRMSIAEKLKARSNQLLQSLLDNADPEVSSSARWDLEHTKPSPSPDHTLMSEFLWQCDSPPPRVMTLAEIREHVRTALPDACVALWWNTSRSPGLAMADRGGRAIAVRGPDQLRGACRPAGRELVALIGSSELFWRS